MEKYLISNADDFGYNEQQNAAIEELLKNQLITSTSVLTVVPSAKQAVDFSGVNHIDVGVHLTINSDYEDKKWQSLSNSASFQNGLPHHQKELIFKTARKDVRAELESQYRYIVDNGGTVDHADNHCATLYGINGRRFYLDAYDFCAEHHLPYRFPKTSGFLERQLGRSVPAIIKKYQDMIVHAGEKRGVKLLDDLVSNPWSMDRIKDYNTLEKYYLDDKNLHIEHYNSYYQFSKKKDICCKILKMFGINEEKGHIINGHVPVKIKNGESPVKADGKLFVIDGGISKAYQKTTGIAGYTLIYDSHSLNLAEHKPFIAGESEHTPEIRVVEKLNTRANVSDTDNGKQILEKVDDLRELLNAYNCGLIKES